MYEPETIEPNRLLKHKTFVITIAPNLEGLVLQGLLTEMQALPLPHLRSANHIHKPRDPLRS